MIFSPIFETKLTIKSLTVTPSIDKLFKSSRLFALVLYSDIFEQKFRNSLFFATKSVSELISVNAKQSLSSPNIIKPSAASLELFFAAFKTPFFLKYSIDLSILLSFSLRAFLQSCMPAPVTSLSSLTFSNTDIIFFPL